MLREPTPELRRDFDVQVYRAAAAIAFIQTNGNNADRLLVQQLLDEYGPKVSSVTRSLDAAVNGEPIDQDELPPTELAAGLKRMLEAPAQERQNAAAEQLQAYRNAQETQTAIVIFVLFLGLPVMASLVLLIRVFERRESAANLSMEILEQAALTDSLTGLGNHRGYQEQLAREVRAALSTNSALSLAVLDIDDFKEINDTQGHARGDQILFQMGRLLREVCSPGDQRFRVGGDEFAVIMPGSDEARALELMERFRVLAGLTGATVSIGVAQLEPDDDTEILREKADSTLYTAKRRGRDAVCTFSGDNAEQKVVTQAKIQALRDLLREDRIEVAFQPVLHSSRGPVVGYEALARIPDGFDIEGPQEAFDIAERIGHSHILDLLCIREGLQQAGNLGGDQILFLNVSPRTLESSSFSAAAIANLVLESGLRPEQVCFEITEHTSAPIEVVLREVNALKGCGFKIALDDVGAGNSGLEMMRRLEVDFVKIDRSVLAGALEKGQGRGVFMAIIVFASEAGAFVIAEGIETPEMLAVIEETNRGPFAIQGVQGFILGVPRELPPSLPIELSA
ncbi:MAG: EAL domain-containing protein [Dehalococcoidia bacterium]